jgi:tetraacyldisaccharide 4'-kinase
MSDAARAWLAPLSWLYGAGVAIRNRHYNNESNVERARIPVISVGNLTVGGTGKTPVVSWVARQLQATGHSPAVVSRGYGGSAGVGPVLVSRGDGPLTDVRLAGDEPYQLARTLPGVRVVVGSDRAAGVGDAIRAGADVAILDDGFQHRQLHRDLEIVLLDATNPFGGNRLLPAGDLREPPASLRRADVVLITRSRALVDRRRLERSIRRYQPDAPILFADHADVGFVDREGRSVQPRPRVLAFCGIGNPQRFRRDLDQRGLELLEFRSFGDHHEYRSRDLAPLVARAARDDASLLTTEKDLARLSGSDAIADDVAVLALQIEAVIDQPEPLLMRLKELA